jgi:glucokinase
MLLAGDIGGTKTLLGLFTPKPDRPAAIDVGEFVTLDYDGLEPMIEAFLDSRGVEPRHIDAATFGAAGAVTDQVARMTNVPWLVDATLVAERLKFRRTHVVNDLSARVWRDGARSRRAHDDPERRAASEETPQSSRQGLTARRCCFNVNGRFVPGASEGGTDFAARTPREIELLRDLTRIYGRVSYEAILSGPGLVNVYQFTHQSFGTSPVRTLGAISPERLCPAIGSVSDPKELPARISRAAMERTCEPCVEARSPCRYGAEAGNIALRAVATAVSTSAAASPKILRRSSLAVSRCIRSKEPMADFVATIPIALILNPDAALLARRHARRCRSREQVPSCSQS